ncbi:MAG: methyltransferase [Ottowia sp.]|uniref:class I SAM-dependent methyltransferase n=1 Tax=Ottowia sp. TaxID=1898956 RepID=UPI003C75E7FA
MTSASSFKAAGASQPEHRLSRAWLQERRRFFRALLSNPRSVGALAPSGSALSAAITAGITPCSGKILELGVGTGVFTRALLRNGLDASALVLVESDAEMSRHLRDEFPGATVLNATAQNLPRRDHPALRGIEATICGLPLRNMASSYHRRILAAAFSAMPEHGALYLFTYGLRCPVSQRVLDASGLTAKRTHIVLRNFPPACVYRLARR